MNDLIVQFARLWGQNETYVSTPKEEKISDILRSYDSEECLAILSDWVDEYMESGIEDSCEFFESKLEALAREA